MEHCILQYFSNVMCSLHKTKAIGNFNCCIQVDVSIKYLNFFLEDDDELERIKKVILQDIRTTLYSYLVSNWVVLML